MSGYFEYSYSNDLNLSELALRLRWHAAAERAVTHPHEISEQDMDGLTVLHWVCCNQPPLRLLRAFAAQETYFQEAACKRDANGMTPLLCACACHASTSVIAFLAQTCIKSVSILDQDGWSVLHYVTTLGKGQYERVVFLSTMLFQLRPELVLIRDQRRRTPLQSLCDQYSRELRSLYHGYHESPEMNEEMRKLWSVVEMLVNGMSNSGSKSIVRRLLEISDCPEELAMLSVRMESDKLDTPDEKGNTALHLALEAKAESFASFMLEESPTISARNLDYETPLCVARRKFDGWRKIHLDLLEGFPEAIPSSDMSENLYPALLERIDGCHNTIFRLLKESPTLLGNHER
jgi:ankyrin repeat protein